MQRVDEMDVMEPAEVITRSPRGRSGRQTRAFRAVPASTRSIRSFVREVLSSAGAARSVVADFELVVSELAANAIEHGAGDEVTIEVDAVPSCWEVVVASDGTRGRIRREQDWTIASADAGSGRGLGIVRQLMDDVRVDRRGDRLAVRCRKRR